MAEQQLLDQQPPDDIQLQPPHPKDDMIACVMALEAALLPCLPARELQAIDRSPHPSHQIDVERHARDFMEAAKKLHLYFIGMQHEDQPTKAELLQKDIAVMEEELKTKNELIKKQERLIQGWRKELKDQLEKHKTELERGEHQFILWNPTIRFSKTILVPKHVEEGLKQCTDGRSRKYFLLGFGFGWDSVTNDYKIITPPMELDSSSSVVVVVYSSNTNSWSNIKVSSSNIYCFNSYFKWPCVIVNGSPYWNNWKEENDDILKFDTRNDEFTSLDMPSGDSFRHLINLNDCLALIDFQCGYEPTVIYRFDEEHNIWIHMYTLAHKTEIGWLGTGTVYCFKYGGEIVFHDKDHLCLYDPMSNKIKRRRHHPRCEGCPVKSHKHKYRGSHDCEAYLDYGVSYTPSLVALQGMKAFISSVIRS